MTFPIFFNSVVCRVGFVLLLSFFNVPAHAQEDFRREVLNRIENSQAQLESISSTVNREKRTYAERLSAVEQEVRQLRSQAAGIQREADEQLVSLQDLQERLQQWQDQKDYQNHLLQRHTELISESSVEVPPANTDEADLLALALKRLSAQLNPVWQEERVALPSGEFAPAQVISFGPAQWFYAPERQLSGLYQIEPGRHLKSYFQFSGGAHDSLAQLASSGGASVQFDPTQGRAIEIAQHDETLLQHLQKGGLWVLPILFFGLLAFIIAIFKAVQLMRLPKPSQRVLEKLEQLLAAGDSRSLETARRLAAEQGAGYGRIVDIVAKHPPSQTRDDLLFSHLAEQRRQVDRFLDVISLTAAVAPLLGLLGTVSGMIKTFKMLTIFGSGDPAAVSGGISEALVTTELGLIVAIPALVVNAFLSRKAKRYMHDLEDTAIASNSHGATSGHTQSGEVQPA